MSNQFDPYNDKWRYVDSIGYVCTGCGLREGMKHPPTCPWYPEPMKESNPKDAVGIKKVPFSTIPATVMAEVGVALLEGARKYGRHNYRSIGVRASVYYDAALRHLTAWYEGENLDPASGLSHITKCIAGLVVLRDAMIMDKMNDDRPPVAPPSWQEKLNREIEELFIKYPESKPAYTEKEHGSES